MNRLIKALSFWRILAALVFGAGIVATVVRFGWGLGASTNLSDSFPWGIWVGFDVLVGVGLAAGGFTITAVVHIFNLKRFRPIVRPTVLTAFLGYLLVVFGLLFDLGRPYRIWHPLVMWNPHSVMFEVAWCVMFYNTVLALEFSPLVFERLRMEKPLRIIRAITVPIVIAGVLLSTLHQSSLGTLYVILPDKLHAFWYSPLLPVLFFFSAIAAGLSMVIVESFISARAFGRHLEMHILEDLARAIVVVLGLYLVIRIPDLHSRGFLEMLSAGDEESFMLVVEILFGSLVPMAILAIPRLRIEPAGLFCAALLVVLGFIMNRLNVAVTGLQQGLGADYFPSWMEFAVTGSLVAAGFMAFGLAARHLPIFPEDSGNGHSGRLAATSGLPYWAPRGSVVALAVVLVVGAFLLRFETAQSAEVVTPPNGILVSDIEMPAEVQFPMSEDSPGPVVFRHESHVDEDAPNCSTCHAGTFSLLRSRQADALLGDRMHQTDRCGSCHDGETSFDLQEDCETCHSME